VASRLQIGVSRLEFIEPKIRAVFLNKTWIHLGDTSETIKRYSGAFFVEIFKKYSIKYILFKIFNALRGNARPRVSAEDAIAIYEQTNFQDFYFKKGESLEFDDDAFDFIYSEHFFEHLFFDEAVALFKECHRILKPGGVIRTAVPDADLRTYIKPEAVGFPDIKEAFTTPLKHKTRWSVYMLTEALKFSGFDAIPLTYCNREGEYIKNDPNDLKARYEGHAEKELIFNSSYVIRPDSLIVDGFKHA